MAALGGLLLAFSLFLGWYSYRIPVVAGVTGTGGADRSISGLSSGWDSIGPGDVGLIFIAIIGLSGAVLAVVRFRDLRSAWTSRLTLWAGVIGSFYVVFRAISGPGEYVFGYDGPAPGILVALIACGLVAFGGLTQIQEERTVTGDASREAS